MSKLKPKSELAKVLTRDRLSPEQAALKSQVEKMLGIQPQAPDITDTLERAKAAIASAQKVVVRQRRHQCRECDDPDCIHFQRVDLDTGEEFDIIDGKYVDLDNGNRTPTTKKKGGK